MTWLSFGPVSPFESENELIAQWLKRGLVLWSLLYGK